MCFHCKKCGNPTGPEDRQATGSNDYCAACYAKLRVAPAKEKKTRSGVPSINSENALLDSAPTSGSPSPANIPDGLR